MKTKTKNNKIFEKILFALLLVIIILSSITIARISQDKPIFAVGESYHSLEQARKIREAGYNIFRDTNPYHYLLALLLLLLPEKTLGLYLPLLTGILTSLLFYKALCTLKAKKQNAAYSIIILALTPVFITLYTGLYTLGFALLLSCAAIILLFSDKKTSHIIGVLVAALLGLTSLTALVITLLIVLVAYAKLKKNCSAIIASLIVPAVLLIGLILGTTYTPLLPAFHSFSFKNSFSLLKAMQGFDIFLLMLFFMGFVLLWNKQKNKNLHHLPVLILVIISFFNTQTRVYASVIITIYVVHVITYFYKRKWHSQAIRTGVLLLVLCSLLFSGLNQASLIVSAQPDKATETALNHLKQEAQGTVLSLEDYSSVIEYYSGKDAFPSPNPEITGTKKDVQNQADAQKIFGSARLKDAEPLLREHNITYIIITPYMKETLWQGREQGLLFLMLNSERFIKKYKEQDISVWEYLPALPMNKTT